VCARAAMPGLPDFSLQHTKKGKDIPNNQTISPSPDSQNIPTSFIARPSQICPNLDIFCLKVFHLATLCRTVLCILVNIDGIHFSETRKDLSAIVEICA
jgi:hypothetical protein